LEELNTKKEFILKILNEKKYKKLLNIYENYKIEKKLPTKQERLIKLLKNNLIKKNENNFRMFNNYINKNNAKDGVSFEININTNFFSKIIKYVFGNENSMERKLFLPKSQNLYKFNKNKNSFEKFFLEKNLNEKKFIFENPIFKNYDDISDQYKIGTLI
jgi:hypothetical protein